MSLLSGKVVKSFVDGGALVGLAVDVKGLRSMYHNTQRVAGAVSLIMACWLELEVEKEDVACLVSEVLLFVAWDKSPFERKCSERVLSGSLLLWKIRVGRVLGDGVIISNSMRWMES